MIRSRRAVWSALLLIAGLCVQLLPGQAGSAPAAADAGPAQGRVVRVIDGDTIEVLGSGNRRERVRLAGIDAPERAQPYSRHSRDALAALVAGRSVRIDGRKSDRWGRRVGNVFVDDRDVGLAMVQAGLAWHFARFAHEQAPDAALAYAQAQQLAREARIGLWAEDDPVPPWLFRTQQNNTKPAYRPDQPSK